MLNLSGSKQMVEVAEGVEAVDYSQKKRCWGHDFTIMNVDGHTVSAMGWGKGIKEGELIVLGVKQGNVLYRVTSIEYKDNPDDMWDMTAEWVPEAELNRLEREAG